MGSPQRPGGGRGPQLLQAADRGLAHLNRLGLAPHLVVGDFDSLGWTPEGGHVIRHPVEKDDTDTMLAIRTAGQDGIPQWVVQPVQRHPRRPAAGAEYGDHTLVAWGK